MSLLKELSQKTPSSNTLLKVGTQRIHRWSGAQGGTGALTNSRKGTKLPHEALTIQDFRIPAFKLTTVWILESVQRLHVHTYHNMDFKDTVLRGPRGTLKEQPIDGNGASQEQYV